MRKLADGRGLAKVSPITRAIVNGEEDLSRWSEEELERGARRGPDGKFRKPPVLIAKAVHDELVKRRMSKAYDLLRESVYDAVALLREVVTDQRADPAVRLKASELILDRVLGKAPQHVSLTADLPPWQAMVTAAIVATEEDAQSLSEGEVVEGEVVGG